MPEETMSIPCKSTQEPTSGCIVLCTVEVYRCTVVLTPGCIVLCFVSSFRKSHQSRQNEHKQWHAPAHMFMEYQPPWPLTRILLRCHVATSVSGYQDVYVGVMSSLEQVSGKWEAEINTHFPPQIMIVWNKIETLLLKFPLNSYIVNSRQSVWANYRRMETWRMGAFLGLCPHKGLMIPIRRPGWQCWPHRDDDWGQYFPLDEMMEK